MDTPLRPRPLNVIAMQGVPKALKCDIVPDFPNLLGLGLVKPLSVKNAELQESSIHIVTSTGHLF